MAHLHLHAHLANGMSHGRAYFYRNSCIDIKFSHDSVPKPMADAFSSISGESYSDTISVVPETKNSNISREKTLKAKLARIKILKSKLKVIDTSIIILAISGLVFAVYDFEGNYQNELEFRYNAHEFSERIRVFISISTFICILLAVVRSRVSYSIKHERKVFLEESIKDYFFSSSFIGLVIELLVLAIHSPPYINYTFEFKQLSGVLYIDLNSICCSLMMMRLFLAFRLFLHYSKWASLKVQMVCQENSVFNPLRFALKACLKDKPHYVLIPVFGISILALGVVMQIYERPYSFDNNLDSGFLDYSYLYNDLWLVILTMTTVGYGDFYPRTHAGRMIAIIAAIWGTFLISLMIIMFNNFVCFNNRQHHSFKIFKKIKDFREMSTFKTQFIKAAIEIYMYKRFHGLNEDHELVKERYIRMKTCRYNWKLKFADTKLKYNDVRDILIEFNDNFSFELGKMTTLIGAAKDLDLQLDKIIDTQKKTLETLLSCSMFSREMNTLVNSSKLRNAN